MRLHCLQHEPHEGPGLVASWCRTHGHGLACHEVAGVAAGESFPEMHDDDALLVMGGGMGANDDGRYPWLTAEKRFIEECARAGRRVIGICLGAQLIASVLGAPVYRNRQKEIGWHPIVLTAAGTASPLFAGCPSSFPVFHWHGDTFDLPAGAVHLASSAATPHQAFLAGERVLGLQFHLETDAALIERFMAGGRAELVAGDFVQEAEEIRLGFRHLDAVHGYLDRLLDVFFRE
jgi:GMP synthase-like glutamine amidotransferase